MQKQEQAIEATRNRKRAVIYCRVSTDKQEQDGESLEYQEKKCRQYADSRDVHVIKVFHEVKSGFIHYTLRDKLTVARQMIRDRMADVIIVWDLRRFSRNFVHSAMIFEEIESHGGEVISVSENIDNTLTGKLIRSILAWSAESEREKIVEYANRHWRERLEQGLPIATSYPPYGWSWGDKEKMFYVINPEEAAVRYSIFHMFVELDMSLRAIAHKLTEDGIPTPLRTHSPDDRRAELWSHTTLHAYLRDPKNIGTLVLAKRARHLDSDGKMRYSPHPERKVVPGGIPAIIPLNLYERAQRKLDTNKVEQSHPPKDPTLYLLKGHIRCASCNNRMSMRLIQRRHYRWPIYYCSNHRNRYLRCPDMPVIRADWIDPLAWGECCQLFERIDRIQEVVEREVSRSVANLLEDTHGEQQRVELTATIEFARTERDKFPVGSYYYNLLSADIQAKTEQLERFEAETRNASHVAAATAFYRERVHEFLGFINIMRGKYHEATFQEKRNALDVLGVEVAYQPRNKDERQRGKDATPEEISRRITITYSPLFTGVHASGEGRPQNQ